MTSGWTVRVSFIMGGQQVTDGQPMYCAAVSDPAHAISAIRMFTQLGPTQAEVEAVDPISNQIIGAMNLRAGNVVRLR
jgi:hypothetical protein